MLRSKSKILRHHVNIAAKTNGHKLKEASNEEIIAIIDLIMIVIRVVVDEFVIVIRVVDIVVVEQMVRRLLYILGHH